MTDELDQKAYLDGLSAEIEVGEEAKRFLESDLGRCIVGIVDQRITDAHTQLEEINPEDTTGVLRLQESIKLSRDFTQWLNQLVTDGEQALLTWAQHRST
jgi:hypothetical protein